MEIYIINPDNGQPVSIQDWQKEEEPARARLLSIETDDGHMLIMSKKYLDGSYDFESAQKACEAFTPEELKGSGITFRCPTRKECIDMYDARFQGLDEAIRLTGGDFAKRGIRHWTCERDADPRYYAYSAWFSIGNNGCANNTSMYNASGAVPVALLK